MTDSIRAEMRFPVRSNPSSWAVLLMRSSLGVTPNVTARRKRTRAISPSGTSSMSAKRGVGLASRKSLIRRIGSASGDGGETSGTAVGEVTGSNNASRKVLAAMAKDLELGGFAPVIKANGEPLDALAQEYERVAAALTELRNA